MEIRWEHVRRVILNDRWPVGYKPNKTTIERVGELLPDCKIFGWGHYGFLNQWYLLVESGHFPADYSGSASAVSLSHLPGYFVPHPPPTPLFPQGPKTA